MKSRKKPDVIKILNTEKEEDRKELAASREEAMQVVSESEYFVLIGLKDVEIDQDENSLSLRCEGKVVVMAAPAVVPGFWPRIREIQSMFTEMNPEVVGQMLKQEGIGLFEKLFKTRASGAVQSKDEEGGPILH